VGAGNRGIGRQRIDPDDRGRDGRGDAVTRGRIGSPVAAALAVAALVVGAAGAAGLATPPAMPHPDPIVLHRAVPVGVQDTPAGAIAAADNYLAAEDRALLSRSLLRTLVDLDWSPSARAAEFARPLPAAALAGKPETFPGLELTAAIAADRLDAYTAGTAQVGVWHEITLWSPTIAPAQRWELDAVSLVWRSGQWQVATRVAAPDAQTPVPSWTGGDQQDRTSAAFDARLAGMSTPYYGGTP
jgi:hypothetical protein